MSKLISKLQWPDFNLQAMFCRHDFHFGLNWRHTHEDYYELVIVRSGNATHCCGNVSTDIHVGDVFLLAPGETHHYLCGRELGIYNLLFSSGFVRHLLGVFPPDVELETLLGLNREPFPHPRFMRPKQQDFLRLVALTEEIITAQQQARPRARIMIAANFMKILLLLCDEEKKNDGLPLSSGDSSFRVACLLRNLNVRFAEKWTLTDMAAYCGLSVSRFRCCFKAVTGFAPGDWLLRTRLYQATQMLTATESNVSEIALACGFSDSNYFTRQFHRLIGVAPLKFRKNPGKIWPLTVIKE